ncbi:hypothetical protein [Wolbachia endosymbiont (group A) of Pipizella viduata]|uniref:hypothetical protein n=1 Tax=Wolbachia endosymbiont (group A) of Pipizella viduata TaxID=3066154 RepID=UPI0033408430
MLQLQKRSLLGGCHPSAQSTAMNEPTGPEPAMIMFFIFTSYEPPNAKLTTI